MSLVFGPCTLVGDLHKPSGLQPRTGSPVAFAPLNQQIEYLSLSFPVCVTLAFK